jgi:cysteine synthase A
MKLRESAADAIGATPLVALNNIAAGLGGRILAKLDYLNPGGSKKDRIARQIMADAIAAGALKPGQPVVELTSGNTGTGAAIVCAAQQRTFIAVMSQGNSQERSLMMRALGAEVILVPQAAGSAHGQVSGEDLALLEDTVRQVVSQRGAFRLDQFNHPGNIRAHELHTGPEIWDACGGDLTGFCDFVGTGGTFAGLARAFRQRNPAVRCYIVEPQQAAALSGHKVQCPAHRIQGGGYAMAELPLLSGIAVDGFLTVSDDEAMAATASLARQEGIFAGFSSGANLAAAIKLLQGPERGGTIAIVICDSGLKYLSTDLWGR